MRRAHCRVFTENHHIPMRKIKSAPAAPKMYGLDGMLAKKVVIDSASLTGGGIVGVAVPDGDTDGVYPKD